MIPHVLRGLERWRVPGYDTHTLTSEIAGSAGITLWARSTAFAIHAVTQDGEALTRVVIPSDVASHLTVAVALRRKSLPSITSASPPRESLLSVTPGEAFLALAPFRLPFHGNVHEGDVYEVAFTNISDVHLALSVVAVVEQP